MCVYIYIYIYRERERERDVYAHVYVCVCMCRYVYIHISLCRLAGWQAGRLAVGDDDNFSEDSCIEHIRVYLVQHYWKHDN